MQLGRRKGTATAVMVAVIGGLLGTAPGASAAPGDSGTPAASTPDREDETAVPAVWPRPQTIRATGGAVPLGDEVTVVTGASADAYAVRELTALLREAGVRTVREVSSAALAGTAPSGTGPVVLAGGTGAQDALRALGAPQRADLPVGGYRIAVGTVAGRDTVALDGVGDDGLFHAAQTLRQLVVLRDRTADRPAVPGVLVRDWPGTAVRGTTEGFYGRPWDQQDRLSQLDFMGRTKQNRYLYAPGDDPFRQARWRDPYPAAQRAGFRELAERARRNHVTLAWAVAPAQAMCMASDKDLRDLTRKIDAMWALGVRAVQLQFQDVSYSEWHCRLDEETFGSGPEAAAKAQARVANAVAAHLADRHAGAEPLTVMPTEYYQDGVTDYREALADALDQRVQVAWTGVGVVPRTITGRELAGARAAFGHPLVTMDNYPVNDYEQSRIFLGPYTGREPAVAAGSVALLANAMEQPSASRIPLFTAADYAWNPRGYRPRESWQAAIDDLAGKDTGAREALRALAGNDASSILDASESAYLKPLFEDFWRSRSTTDARARSAAASRLRAAFTVMREAPRRLAGTAGGRLDDEVRPWLDQLARYGEAGELAVDMLRAQERGDGAAAWQASLDLEPLREATGASRVTVGEGTLAPFIDRAVRESAAWNGTDRVNGEAVTKGARTYTVNLARARPVEAVNTMTEPGTGAGSVVEAHVPGEGWRTLGPLSMSGWTESDAKGLLLDAVRVVWPETGHGAGVVGPGGAAPSVRHVVPWFADEPKARLDLLRDEANAQIGGEPQRVQARLAAQRPGEVRGTLTAKAPSGIRVTVPRQTTLPRGARTDVPVEVSVPAGTPAGTYEVPLAFGGEERTLTVRASPRTGGPDLARTGVAASSGDETPDFPAAAATDGDPASRWSSPVEDGAWWQLELARPARIGQVVLNWQEAYASRYRIQVSADGRTWRTAATVDEGRGGRETIGMDAKDARFIRVQGDARATRYGYSLFSVEVYAVAE
ncbi:beta-N-acetylglucosaminidase domain-containing protein [Streptomyces sp. AK02-01A]|uniref:beta-N-acetylglucosaminidase domain-containing protein n=1 Tax=Streptomyces sp. AK02-01A TaxID=3028648 RepID=UPI0029BD47AA|nr:beta-N-acetylglucosaminidase domain-containing protein [Streptomyces sp. AK02-01A]MDX3849291.1 beta-N-acetylglucosaminidase domain-containing protein [Streptomyces sp. AK02-01A]